MEPLLLVLLQVPTQLLTSIDRKSLSTKPIPQCLLLQCSAVRLRLLAAVHLLIFCEGTTACVVDSSSDLGLCCILAIPHTVSAHLISLLSKPRFSNGVSASVFLAAHLHLPAAGCSPH